MLFNQLKCEICEKEFKFTRGRGNSNRFCSVECVGKHLSNKAKSRYLNNPKHCLTCNNIIPYEKKNNTFCCRSCSATFNNTGTRKHGNPPGECEKCGKPKSSFKRRFCSFKCSNEWVKENNPLTDIERKERHRIKRNEASANYRAKLRNQTPADADRIAIRKFYEACPKGWEVDHIIPISKGGLHTLENLQYLPMNENRSKGSKLIGMVPR